MKNMQSTQRLEIAQTLQVLVTTLEKAVGSHLMKREHAASIWKQLLKDNDIDVPKVEKKIGKGVSKKNGTIKES